MVLGVNRDDENSPCCREERIRQLRGKTIGQPFTRSNIDKLVSSWPFLKAMSIKTILFQEVNEALLLNSLVENRYIYPVNFETKDVVKNDLEESFSQAKAIECYFETTN